MRVRRSLIDLQADYETGNRLPLETLMRAWKGIKELPPTDPNSFFVIAGYHGEPFRGAGWGNSSYWGGYCNHGNVLFPTWHRAYVMRIENALRSIPGCADVMLPFWDETADTSVGNGIPWALTAKFFDLDGVSIPNPLRSYVVQRNIVDHLSPFPDADYGKPIGYETVRYPLSGLVGPNDIATTTAHNQQYPDYATNVGILDKNVVNWLSGSVTINGKVIRPNIKAKYVACLDAPNYTLFSNTTSAAEWNDNAAVRVVALESPHNSMHLAVGGFDLPAINQDFSEIPGANGDMGENDTASFDPIFFFHHCFVDRVFWLWQKRHGATAALDVIAGYPGTNSVDNQGPTPGTPANSWLDFDSPLDPFVRADGSAMTSRDVIDIEGQLGYTYGPGSLDELAVPPTEAIEAAKHSGPALRVHGINRGRIAGSFVIEAYVEDEGQRKLIGEESVLSRWHVEGCANCQTHLLASAVFELPEPVATAFTESAAPPKLSIAVRTRDGRLGEGPAAAPAALTEMAATPHFRVEIR